MNVLGIETSCDETAVAVLNITDSSIEVLSHVVSSQVEIHTAYGGVVPELAAREHMRQCIPILDHALQQARVDLDDIELVAATRGPGLMTSLMVGFETGKAIAFACGIPFVPVNHLIGHVYSWLLPKPGEKRAYTLPESFLTLIVSGGHTELLTVTREGVFTLLGRTVDDAVGEAFDKTAKMMGLPYPGGPQISKYAAAGKRDAFALPRPMHDSGDYTFSFAGLKTAVLYALQKQSLNAELVADMAASFEQAACEVLVKKTMRAANEYAIQDIAVVGGVSANAYLREMCVQKADGRTFHFPEMTYTGDNAAMIALAGYITREKGLSEYVYTTDRVNPNERIV